MKYHRIIKNLFAHHEENEKAKAIKLDAVECDANAQLLRSIAIRTMKELAKELSATEKDE